MLLRVLVDNGCSEIFVRRVTVKRDGMGLDYLYYERDIAPEGTGETIPLSNVHEWEVVSMNGSRHSAVIHSLGL